MIDLSTTYLGLQLKNPVIVSSSGLTDSVDKIKKLAKAGAGAVVLKSLFEEQINIEAGSMIDWSDYPEAEDYILNYTKSNSVEEYLKLIENSKKSVDIPVIASINCTSLSEWVSQSKKIEEAGADALELNVYFLPTDKEKFGQHYEELYYSIISEVKSLTSLPLTIKLGQQFTNLPGFVEKLYHRGVAGAVLFNRFYSPDINTDKLKMVSSEVLSHPSDIQQTLRWVGIISHLVDKIDLSASTGIHDGKAVIKMLLAGATAVQVCSALYRNGTDYLSKMIEELTAWMKSKDFNEPDDFRGMLNYKRISDPAIFERSQFMKYFSEH